VFSGHCVHYAPKPGGRYECELGINIRDHVGGPDFGWLARIPCVTSNLTKDQVACDRRELPSERDPLQSLMYLIGLGVQDVVEDWEEHELQGHELFSGSRNLTALASRPGSPGAARVMRITKDGETFVGIWRKEE
jgi:hypothetical protein